jgi:hypothetical protein
VRSALLADPELSERQKQVLIEIYESFRKENAAVAEAQTAEAEAAQAAAETKASKSSWSDATAEAEQDERSGDADISGPRIPSD